MSVILQYNMWKCDSWLKKCQILVGMFLQVDDDAFEVNTVYEF